LEGRLCVAGLIDEGRPKRMGSIAENVAPILPTPDVLVSFGARRP
jgi:hypothetical protein